MTMHLIQAGQYELKHNTSSLYLNSLDAPVYNGEYDDALVLEGRPSRLGKVSILVPLYTAANSDSFCCSGKSNESGRDIQLNRCLVACIARYQKLSSSGLDQSS